MWAKKGLIFNVDGRHDWNKSHAQVPVADVLEDRIRVYYAARNQQGKSNVFYIEVDKNNPRNILYTHDQVLLPLGALGAFDDSGIMPTCIINVGDLKYLYYIGWTTRLTVPYQNAVGLAISYDGGKTFTKFSQGPIITVNHVEPYFSGTAYVMFDEGLYKMWYLSCIGWKEIGDKIEPLYNIKYAEAPDGINWVQTGKVAIELQEGEGGLVSASVIRKDGRYHMWYGKRAAANYRTDINASYRIGYAVSDDGKNWIRKDDEAGIEVAAEGWDAEMISYPNVVKLKNDLLMFYNGNGFGKTGFGYATHNLNDIL